MIGAVRLHLPACFDLEGADGEANGKRRRVMESERGVRSTPQKLSKFRHEDPHTMRGLTEGSVGVGEVDYKRRCVVVGETFPRGCLF